MCVPNETFRSFQLYVVSHRLSSPEEERKRNFETGRDFKTVFV